ncbi:uncharacterized protein LOC114526022 [Dendronephthya gigantea]|uniref:uncharacterized protein LOC114526022 n=1 Tax=Dendronephthya gigantea TaxID=151771 RepID=UPI00106BF4DF|nr:uncharacterized protein LOC114526022 [Dendronephthya gigantea]XP_028403317.1 uncharacterized protein LOC114526022 [Dendronephthya gigantea]
MAEGNCQSKMILVDNQSALPVTLFLHKNWNKRQFLSISKTVKPGGTYFHSKEEAFRFELGVRYDGKNMETIFPLKTCEEDMVLQIYGDVSLGVNERKLELKDKQICLRRQNMEEEVSATGNKNLYEILGLNMKDVRKKPVEEQNEMIKKAYRSQLLRWHPDKNPKNGDETICQDIILAYKILKDPEARAAYNNVADYDKGWGSKARGKAIFNPDCYSPEQIKQYRKRMGLLILSTLLAVGGVGVTFLTAGMTAPAVLGIVAASGALVGGGITSGLRTMTRDSIQNGCAFEKYFKSLLIGAVGGVALATGAAGFAAFFGGAAKIAIKAFQVSLEDRIVQRLANSAFQCFVNSVTNTFDAVLAGEEKLTGKKIILLVLIDAFLGGIAGASGGMTEKMIEGTVSPIEAEMAFVKISSISGNGVENLTKVIVDSFTTTVSDRFNDGDEKETLLDHIKNGTKQVASVVRCYCFQCGGKLIRSSDSSETENTVHINHQIPDCECLIRNKSKLQYFSEGTWFSKMLVDYEENGEEKHHEGKGSGSLILIPNNATKIKVRFQVMRAPGVWCDVKKYDVENRCWVEPKQPHTFDYTIPVSRTYTLAGMLRCEKVINITGESDYNLPSYMELTAEINNESTASVIHRLKYISEGSWVSKMLVDYEEDGETKHQEVKDSKESFLIPTNATNIEVRFQVMRAPGVWSDVKKYDRFNECWVKPAQPHIFKYDKPVSCTYTLDGNFFYEKVENISEDRQKKEYTKGKECISSHEPKHYNVKDATCSILIPKKAINPKAEFQDIPCDQVWGSETTTSSSIQGISTQGFVYEVPDLTALFVPVKVPRTNWFVQNILDENLNMKEEYEKELSRLSWVRDFYIGFDGKKDKTWKIFITHVQNKEPSMKELREIFSVKHVASFVDFIPEQRKKVTGKSRFLQGPKTGDGIHEENGFSDGKICIICVGDPRTRSHYAMTSYHVCYNNRLPEDLFEAHRDLKRDYQNGSPNCRDVTYRYTDENERGTLGKFYCGLYNDEHDIALVKLESHLSCQHHITFLNRREIETTLASKKDVMEKMEEMLGSVPVKIIGSIIRNGEGILFAINARTTNDGMNKGFYRIRGVGGENFAEEGDSGALVYMICDDHKNIPFAYVSNVNERGIYYCGNLKFSLESLNPDMKPCLGQCGFE